MSGLHLNHKLPWRELVGYFTSYKDPGIELPVGTCGRIHLINKKTQLQVDQRKYLTDDQICTDTECQVTGSSVFRKSLKTKGFSTRRPRDRSPVRNQQLNRFTDCLSRAIREFAETERGKVVVRSKMSVAKLEQEVFPPYGHCKCRLVTTLIEAGDTNALLSLGDEEILSVLGCQHGGQAVGNNIKFLTHYVIHVYVWTNLIVAAGFQDDPEKWGPMSPGAYFRGQLMWDCDGQTFLSSSRKFLTDDVYMKDWEATRQLCKDCFRFLYFTEMLRLEVDKERPIERLTEDMWIQSYY